MNDIPNEKMAGGSGEPGANGEPGSRPDTVSVTPAGMLPLVEPFFGKRAFLIAALPFVIYYIGTALGSHFEMTRKTGPAHEIRGLSTGVLDAFVASNQSDMLEEDAQAILDKYGLPSVKDALEDESSKVEVLFGKCRKLVEGGNFEDEPVLMRARLVRLRVFVEKFLEIQGYWEEDELHKIRPAYMVFAEEYLPGEPLKLNDSWYPATYTFACLAALVAVIFAMPTYLKKMPFRISFLALAVGTIGVVLWVGIWWLNKEYGLGTASKRAAFNPFEELKNTPVWMWTFLGIRLLGMVLVIPIAEEFFTRGFLMRYCEDIDWDQIPIGRATWRGLAGILAYAAFSHGETLAALVWFGLVTWMYLKTKNIWDCVVAHAVTNGLLAAYVLKTGTWVLW